MQPRATAFGLLLAACTLCAQPAPHPTPVTIHVTDQTGAQILKANVSMLDADGTEQHAMTNPAGEAQFDLHFGAYKATVTAQGFATEIQTIKVPIASPVQITVVLPVGQCSPCIEVVEPDPVPLIPAEPLASYLEPIRHTSLTLHARRVILSRHN